MDAQRYARLKALVVEAATLPLDERPAFLAAACAGDAELRREAETLLAQERVVPSLLGGAVGGLAFDRSDEPAPARIGPYTLHEVLGQGGMGIVYRATQETPLRREVALKLVRAGGSGSGVLARFEVERRTLAHLEHPAIARVLDAGSAPDGRPYFAMECVRGRPINAFADAERLTTRQRLDLFLAVCAGVQHAHQKGIIHRDIKPSNILVTREADGPRPHIIDFGIARAIESSAETRLTLSGHLLGTPDYMSPEQAGALEADVDTRTDVYALGVVLYELLTGMRPYTFARITAGEIQRVLGGPPPRRPSTAVADAIARAGDAGLGRRSAPARLRRQLRGDLDNIALKALAREPDQRYVSVEQLATDIRRHLAGLPVVARAATWRYRAGKFARRHALAVAAAAIIAVLLAGFSLFTARQARVLAVERDRARREAETARQVSDFMVDLFQVADPSESRGNSITVREILDRGAERIPAGLADQPVVQARLLSTLGQVYYALGLYEPAAKLLERAQQRYESLASPEPAALADTLDAIGSLAHDMRDLPRAEEYARRALELRRRALGHEHPDVAASLISVAIALRNRDRHADAEPLYREALALYRRTLGGERVEVASALFNLGWALHQQGRVDEAEPLYREAAALQRRLLGATHPDLGDTLNSLAGIPFYQGRFESAAEIWQEAFDMYQRLYGDRHAASARAYHNLARAHLVLGRFTKAEPLFRRAVELSLELNGPDHPHTATTMHSHGVALWRLGRLADAEQRLRAALAVRRRAFGDNSRYTGVTLGVLAGVLLDRGRVGEAETAAREAARVAESEAAKWPSNAATMLESLAAVLLAQGRVEQSLPLWERAVGLREAAQDSTPVELALAKAGAGEALLGTGQTATGLERLRQARAALEAALPDEHPELARVRGLLARHGPA